MGNVPKAADNDVEVISSVLFADARIRRRTMCDHR